jgi:hypothetical protein
VISEDAAALGGFAAWTNEAFRRKNQEIDFPAPSGRKPRLWFPDIHKPASAGAETQGCLAVAALRLRNLK